MKKMQAKLKELSEEFEKKVNQILTESQQEKFADLKGKPFELTRLRAQPSPAIQ